MAEGLSKQKNAWKETTTEIMGITKFAKQDTMKHIEDEVMYAQKQLQHAQTQY